MRRFLLVGAVALAGAVPAHSAPAYPAPADPPAAAQLLPDQFTADEIVYQGTLDAATAAELAPLHKLDEIAALFFKHGIRFVRRQIAGPVSTFPDSFWAQVDKLPPGEPLVLPHGDRGAVLVILTRHSTPSV